MPWLTGDDPGTSVVCYTLEVPDDPTYIRAVRGAILEMTAAYNWETYGDLTADEAAELAWGIFDSFEEC